MQSSTNIGLSALSLISNGIWQQLLPSGYFSAIDGRPKDTSNGQWFLNREHAEKLITQINASVNELVIDYEHQTLNTDQNGQPAPAAGWFKSEIEWRENSGLWIMPQWTRKAIEHIKQGEYRFLSAVFTYDRSTGAPLTLHSAALVNRPGLDGLQAVELLKANIYSSPSSVIALSNNAITTTHIYDATDIPIVSEEREILEKYSLTDAEYKMKRQFYCDIKKRSWAKLCQLNTEDVYVIERMSIAPTNFIKIKIGLIAEDLILNY